MTPAGNLSMDGRFRSSNAFGMEQNAQSKCTARRIAAGDKLKAIDYTAGVLRAAR
jgi:hypothetical protein